MQATGPDHERWGDAAGSYLLGALPDDERHAYEAHLATCAACRDEVDELAPAAHALPASVEPVAPPPELKARIMVEVEREAALLVAAGPQADRPPAPAAPRRRRWRFGLPGLAPVAAAVALLFLGIAAGVAGDRLLRDGGARTVTAVVDASRAPRAQVQLEIDGEEAMLVARGLPAPPRGRVYDIWLKRPGRAPEPTSALFVPRGDGTATTAVPGPLDDVEQLLVTHEPMGGSRVPTSDPLLVMTPS
jgi:anti-sigma-K factor RskA